MQLFRDIYVSTKKIRQKISNFTFKRLVEKTKANIRNSKHEKKLAFYRAESERLAKNHLSRKSLRLHFGCGYRVLKDWINIDIYFGTFEQYLSEFNKKDYPQFAKGTKDDFYSIDFTEISLPLPDNSVDAIFHEDFIEHLGQKDQVIFLAETYRVLKPGGVHRVNTPELLKSIGSSDFIKGKNGVHTEEWDSNGHYNVLTKKSLDELARTVGYREINFNQRNKSLSALIPKEYRPGSDRPEDGNIFADLIK